MEQSHDTCYSQVLAKFTFPPKIKERDFQVDTINELAPLDRAGYYLDMGTGKTFCSTVSALYKFYIENSVGVTVIVMPPILLKQWEDWLNSIRPPLSVLRYVGSPAVRKKFALNQYDFILMSIQIFKNDYDYLVQQLKSRKRPLLIVDEASSIKNISSANHKKVRDYVNFFDAQLMLLTGTPLTTPLDGYAFVKTLSPSVYRNFNQFTNIHVEEVDFFNKPVKWKNLDILAENMALNSKRILRRDVKNNLPPCVVEPVYYDLDPAHAKLYRKLMEEQLLKLPDGGKIDATESNALYHKAQQIICNYDHFTGDAKNVSAAIEVATTVLDGLEGKLAIVANYKMTNAQLVARLAGYGAVAIYGEVNPKQKEKNLERFLKDDDCRVIILQPQSAGMGLDGMQFVCSTMLFLEMPVIPRDYHQTVARIDRDGQSLPVQILIGVASNTVQVKLLNDLLSKDEVIGKVQPNIQDLRNQLFGD